MIHRPSENFGVSCSTLPPIHPPTQKHQVQSLGRRHPRVHIPPHPSDTATICYTSGTTGTPKGEDGAAFGWWMGTSLLADSHYPPPALLASPRPLPSPNPHPQTNKRQTNTPRTPHPTPTPRRRPRPLQPDRRRGRHLRADRRMEPGGPPHQLPAAGAHLRAQQHDGGWGFGVGWVFTWIG